jgi:hypothetical protein
MRKCEGGRLFQRLPQASGANGSITTLVPAGMLSTIHARASSRVSVRVRTTSL